MAFNRSSVNLGNQFSHAAEVAKGEARENETRSRRYYKLPPNVQQHKWTDKEERFNILLAKNNASDPDTTGYKFYKQVPVHELPNMADPKHPHQYPCPRIIGKPCPVCDRKEQEDDGTKGGENWDRIKPFMPKDRVLYYFNPEGTDKVTLHECAARQKGEAAFPQRLMAQATAMGEGGLPIPFASPNSDGKIIKVNTAKDSFDGHEYYNASAVNFFDRKELPLDEAYDKCAPWNEILNFASYDSMQKVMNGEEPDDLENASAAPVAPQHTEEQRQQEFDKVAQEEQARRDTHPAPQDNGFQKAPAAQGFTSTPADQPVREFPSEQPQQSAGCPNGLRLGQDFETSRKCCNCAAYEACRQARRNG